MRKQETVSSALPISWGSQDGFSRRGEALSTRKLPVPTDWHEDYAQGRADTAEYRQWRGWDVSAEQEECRE